MPSGFNLITLLQVLFIRVAIVLESEKNGFTCKLHLQKFYQIDPCLTKSKLASHGSQKFSLRNLLSLIKLL